MTLLQQIIGDAVDANSDLPSLLRRCRILAQRLALDEFKQWVVSELEGYVDGAEVPAYRLVETPLHLGSFNGYGGRKIENGQIPISSIPEAFKPFFKAVAFRDGLGELVEMIRNSPDGVRSPWPVEIVRHVGQGNIYDGFHLMQALRIISRSSMSGVLEQVRNRILSFALELDSRNPEAGEPVMTTPKIPQDQVRNIFHTTIKGDVQNLAQSSHDFTQTAQANIAKGDLAELKRSLSESGISAAELSGLEIAIAGDRSAGELGMGQRVKGWLGGVALKVADGTIATGIVIISAKLKAYFGI